MSEPLPGMLGMVHLALFVPTRVFDETVRFYREGLGLRVDWQPDPDNVYLTSGRDNVALHRVEQLDGRGALDHLGFAMPSAADVERWHERLSAHAQAFGIEIATPVKRHRDGSTSFYLRDPAGNAVQMIHLPYVGGSGEGQSP